MGKPFRGLGLRPLGDREEKQARTETAFQKERRRIQTANDEKTKRLRALRLEKEAGERAAAEKTTKPATSV